MTYEKELLHTYILEKEQSFTGINLIKSREYVAKIDELVFKFPNHNFENAVSHASVDLRSADNIMPDELLEYFKVGDNFPIEIGIEACSRVDRAVFVSIFSEKRKLTFAIDQTNKYPTLIFEEADNCSNWIIQTEPFLLTWQEFETGYFVVNNLAETLDLQF